MGFVERHARCIAERGQRIDALAVERAFAGDGDNSSSMRRVKSGAYGCMIHAAGAGGGRH